MSPVITGILMAVVCLAMVIVALVVLVAMVCSGQLSRMEDEKHNQRRR